MKCNERSTSFYLEKESWVRLGIQIWSFQSKFSQELESKLQTDSLIRIPKRKFDSGNEPLFNQGSHEI